MSLYLHSTHLFGCIQSHVPKYFRECYEKTKRNTDLQTVHGLQPIDAVDSHSLVIARALHQF